MKPYTWYTVGYRGKSVGCRGIPWEIGGIPHCIEIRCELQQKQLLETIRFSRQKDYELIQA